MIPLDLNCTIIIELLQTLELISGVGCGIVVNTPGSYSRVSEFNSQLED
jgi:hypothetical protein